MREGRPMVMTSTDCAPTTDIPVHCTYSKHRVRKVTAGVLLWCMTLTQQYLEAVYDWYAAVPHRVARPCSARDHVAFFGCMPEQTVAFSNGVVI